MSAYQLAFIVCLIVLCDLGNNHCCIVVGNCRGRFEENGREWRWFSTCLLDWNSKQSISSARSYKPQRTMMSVQSSF
jgi:hypothetical protein